MEQNTNIKQDRINEIAIIVLNISEIINVIALLSRHTNVLILKINTLI